MKILAITVWRHRGENAPPLKLGQSKKLDSFSYFQQGSILQGITASSRIVVQRTQPNTRQTVELEDIPFYVHVYVRSDGLCGSCVADKDYPARVAFTYLSSQLSQYEQYQPHWSNITIDQNNEIEFLNNDIIKYQNPNQADNLTRIQSNLDDITQIMHKNIEEVLKRGEHLDTLMEKSDDLSTASKVFYKQAKKTNQCCSYY